MKLPTSKAQPPQTLTNLMHVQIKQSNVSVQESIRLEASQDATSKAQNVVGRRSQYFPALDFHTETTHEWGEASKHSSQLPLPAVESYSLMKQKSQLCIVMLALSSSRSLVIFMCYFCAVFIFLAY